MLFRSQPSAQPSGTTTSTTTTSTSTSTTTSTTSTNGFLNTTITIPNYANTKITADNISTSPLESQNTREILITYTSSSSGMSEEAKLAIGIVASVATGVLVMCVGGILHRRNSFVNSVTTLLSNVETHGRITHADQMNIDILDGLWRAPLPYSNDYLHRGGVQRAVNNLLEKMRPSPDTVAQAASRAAVELADQVVNEFFNNDVVPAERAPLGLGNGPIFTPNRPIIFPIGRLHAAADDGAFLQVGPGTPRLLQLGVGTLDRTEINTSNLDPQLLDAYKILYDAHLIPTNTAEKALLILLAQGVMASIKLNPAPFNNDSKIFLDTFLDPLYKFEMASYGLDALNQGSLAAQLGASTNLNIVKLDRSQFTWDIAFKQQAVNLYSNNLSGKQYYSLLLGDTNKDI